jgi:hypothetical protein
VVNPWSREEFEPIRRPNGAGDLVQRHGARSLVRSVHAALGWAIPSLFLSEGDPFREVELALGAYVRESQPGFEGTNFQGILSFEAAYGACEAPGSGAAQDGCSETLGVAGCASCGCQDCACTTDPYCCDVQWDALCVEICNEDCGGCGGGLADDQGDVVDRLMTAGRTQGATVGEVAASLKDRLVGRGWIDEAEASLVQDLVGVPLDTPISAEHEPAIRAVCGAVLLSPDFQLSVDRGPLGDRPPIVLDEPELCAFAVDRMAAIGETFTCEVAP